MSSSYSSSFSKAVINSSKGLLFLIMIFLLFGTTAQAQQGLKAEYYDGVDFDRFVSVRFVENIDDYWNGKPPVRGIDPYRCSIRWTGKLKPGKSGNYKFSARVDDGIRVWIDDQLIIDQWELNDVGVFESALDLVANQEYKMKVEYFNALIEGEVRLLWRIPGAEKSWYEYIFGMEADYVVIAPEYFFLPDEFDEKEEETALSVNYVEPNTASETIPKVDKPKKKTVSAKKPKNNSTVKPIESKKPAAPITIVTAKEAEKYIPKNIAFERAKAIFLESSIKELDLFAQFMMDHPQLDVTIEGHTDPVGDEAMNLQLSKQRAYKVARYLVDKGINKDRIKAEGYGGSKPLVVPEKGNYYPANRRVVFIMSGLEG